MARGKLILITGVTRGLGRALADGFVRQGHTVVGCARSSQAIKQLREAVGEPHDFYPVNVASDDEVKTWASLVLNKQGAPDLLLNNAAIINANARLWEVSAREFSEVVDINLKGVANVIRHFAPAMVRRKTGVIVNFSSGWGRSTDAEVRAVLRDEMGGGRPDAVPGAGTARRDGRRGVESRDHQHGHAPQQLRWVGLQLSHARTVGRGRRAVPVAARSPGQRRSTDRARSGRLTEIAL